jgi:hypothetical protein
LKTNSRSVGQEMPYLLWDRKIQYRIHKSPKIINKAEYYANLISLFFPFIRGSFPLSFNLYSWNYRHFASKTDFRLAVYLGFTLYTRIRLGLVDMQLTFHYFQNIPHMKPSIELPIMFFFLCILPMLIRSKIPVIEVSSS